jgi:two-component system cell cycle sensor histidine kinase/response regulator CckA
MNGHELIGQLKARRPALKVIMISGYADESVANDKPGGAVRFLQKPFTQEMLTSMVREILTSPGKPRAFVAETSRGGVS